MESTPITLVDQEYCPTTLDHRQLSINNELEAILNVSFQRELDDMTYFVFQYTLQSWTPTTSASLLQDQLQVNGSHLNHVTQAISCSCVTLLIFRSTAHSNPTRIHQESVLSFSQDLEFIGPSFVTNFASRDSRFNFHSVMLARHTELLSRQSHKTS